jgi:hypothetical protein
MSTLFPDLTQGLNRFTADVFNQMADLLEEWARVRPFIEELQRQQRRLEYFPAIIRGYVQIGSNYRWRYAWEQAWWDEDVTGFVTQRDQGGITSGAEGSLFDRVAYNRLENANTNSGVVSGGVNIDSTSYPDSFCPRPVLPNDGTIYTCTSLPSSLTWAAGFGPVVLMESKLTKQGGVVYFFDFANAHDGDC